MRNLFFLVGLFLSTTLFADQTFVNESAILEEVYYGVPISVEIIEHDVPTDYFLSVGSGTIWEQISGIGEWGDSRRYESWAPSFLASSLKLGIHTGLRNSGTFSTLPTDESDVTFDILGASATFEVLDEIWWDDVFYLGWNLDRTTVPDELILEYREASGTWTLLDTISTDYEGISIHNEIIDEDVEWRLTYIGNAYGYEIARTESEYLDYDFEIINQDYIESRVWGDNQIITIEYEKARLSEYTYVLVYLDDEVIDTLFQTDYSSTYMTENDFDGTIELDYVAENGDELATLEISSKNKYFEVSPLTDEEYTVNSNIPFHWSYSDDWDLVETYVKRNSSTTYTTINEDWELARQYNYAVLESDTTLTFMFIVTDGVTEIVREVGPVSIGEHCREDELLREIVILNEEIATLTEIIDSLENREPEYIMVTIIKDVPTGVEDELEIEVNKLTTLVTNGDYIYYPKSGVTHVYIISLTGQIVYEKSGTAIETDISTSELSSGVYILLGISEDNEYDTYKFIK